MKSDPLKDLSLAGRRHVYTISKPLVIAVLTVLYSASHKTAYIQVQNCS